MYNCINEALKFLTNPSGTKRKRINQDTVHKIETLMRQYYYGIEAKKELWYCLVYDCGVIPESKDPMLN